MASYWPMKSKIICQQLVIAWKNMVKWQIIWGNSQNQQYWTISFLLTMSQCYRHTVYVIKDMKYAGIVCGTYFWSPTKRLYMYLMHVHCPSRVPLGLCLLSWLVQVPVRTNMSDANRDIHIVLQANKLLSRHILQDLC